MIKHQLCLVLLTILLMGCGESVATPASTSTPASTPASTMTPTVAMNMNEPMSAVVVSASPDPTETVPVITRSAPATPTRFVATEDASMTQPMLLTAMPTLYARLTEQARGPVQNGSLDDVLFDVPNEWFVSDQGSKSVRIEPKVADGKTFIRLELVEDRLEISQLIGERLLSYDRVIPVVEDVNNPSLLVRRLALVDSVLVLMEGETLAKDGGTYRLMFRDVYDSLSNQSLSDQPDS